MKKIFVGSLSLVCAAWLIVACSTTTTTTSTSQKKEEPQGFFRRMMDQMTERECQVSRFTCPYGWGPAGERCDCTDASGRVWYGYTIK